MIEAAATMYCKPALQLENQLYRVEGKDVLEVYVPESKEKPVYALDEDNRPKAYLRIKDETILATPVHLNVWFHNKKRSGSDLYRERTVYIKPGGAARRIDVE